MIKRPIPTKEEVVLDEGDFIVSKTDIRGIIKYVNRVFIKISRYSEVELIGKPHNIIRHPDMPKAAFFDLWQNIQRGKEWRGLVKNLCKDGAFYWVDAYVTPNLDSQGKIIGFTSMRRKVSQQEILKITPIYQQMLQEEKKQKSIYNNSTSA